MKAHYYYFESGTDPELHGFTDDPSGEKLPKENGPWTLIRGVGPEDNWSYHEPRSVVAAGIALNGFYLASMLGQATSPKPLIESDRVEGTTVYDPRGNSIGTIKRLMIEKLSGKVAYAVMSFGGFLGIGEEEHTIPWEKLTYDPGLGGYQTDITEEQLRGAPTFYRDRGYDWTDRKREAELHDYWRAPPYWGV